MFPSASISYALDQLRNQAGTNFDPDLKDRGSSIHTVFKAMRTPKLG